MKNHAMTLVHKYLVQRAANDREEVEGGWDFRQSGGTATPTREGSLQVLRLEVGVVGVQPMVVDVGSVLRGGCSRVHGDGL
jgi:hypothetical protein